MQLVLVPSARLVGPDLQAEFGPIPPALIPLDGRPAMEYILDASASGSHGLIAAHEGLETLRERCDDLEVVDVGPTTSLGATVLTALDHAELDRFDRLVVNFADTLVPGLPESGDAIAYRVEFDPYRWTAFEGDEHGGIGAIVEKDVDKGGRAMRVFVGVFAFADPQAFAALLRAAVAAPQPGVDPLYTAVAAYVAARGPGALHRADVWHDVGHVDTYYRTRQRLFIDRRAFNDVEVDARRGVIRKRSTDAAKLRRETAWYHSLPPHAAVLAPRVLGEGSDEHEAYVDLEFYGYPPLADAYLYGAWDRSAWTLALDAIADAAGTLHGERLDISEHDTVAALEAMYVGKTHDRLAPTLDDPRFDALRGDRLMIDGELGLGLDGALQILPDLIESTGLCAPRPLGIIHGDLCLSNLLYDRRNGIVRLIDPRGSFGDLTMHGDPLYDHAKLAHSIGGDYDHLLRGLFSLDVRDGAVDLDVRLTAAQRSVKQLHRQRVLRTQGPDAVRIGLIMSLLFLTMVPLHADRPQSQLAFLVRGLGTLSRVAAREGRVLRRAKIAA